MQKNFLEKLSKDKTFSKEFVAQEAQALLKFAKKAGFECTAEELKEVTGGMSDQEYFKKVIDGKIPMSGTQQKITLKTIYSLFVRRCVISKADR